MSVKYETTYDRLLVIDKEGILRHKGTTLASNDLDNAIEVIETYIDQVISSVEEKHNFNVRTYPVPTAERLSLEFYLEENSNISIDIYDATGKVLQQGFNGNLPAGPNTVNFDVSSDENGIYFYRIRKDENQLFSGRFYIRK